MFNPGRVLLNLKLRAQLGKKSFADVAWNPELRVATYEFMFIKKETSPSDANRATSTVYGASRPSEIPRTRVELLDIDPTVLSLRAAASGSARALFSAYFMVANRGHPLG